MSFRCIRCKSEIDPEFKACPKCGEPVTDFLRRYLREPIDGKYEIEDRLGVGGMGEVYRVRHKFLGSERVVKVIRPQISEHEDAHERFLREARVATKIQHPNVATVHDFAELPDGSHYMVWEFIPGVNLAQQMKVRGTLPPRYAIHIAIEALRGLEAIHRAGIIHRDISPENLMITRDDQGVERVKIIDLGVAKSEEAGADNVTRTGVFVGKFRYASPEHLGFLPEGERIDGRADLYSLGIVLYEMLAGRPPFEATTPHQYVLLHSKESEFKPLDLPANLAAGPVLQQVLRRSLERDRKKRFGSAAEFAQALQEVERTLPDPSAMQTTAEVLPMLTGETTLRTPVPTSTGAKTVPRPPATERIAVPERKRSVMWIPIFGLVLAAGVAAILLLPRRKESTATITAPVTVATQSQPPTTTVEVVPPPQIENPTETASPLLTSTTERVPIIQTTTRAAARPAPPPPAPPPPTPEPQPVPVTPQPTIAAYIDGRTGNEDANDRLIERLRNELKGVTKIGVIGSEHLLRTLQNEIESVSFVRDRADVNIEFEGTIEPLGRGRKRRSGQGTITKGGRVIFRYQLPPEEYRVGDTPAEAFTNVIADAVEE